MTTANARSRIDAAQTALNVLPEYTAVATAEANFVAAKQALETAKLAAVPLVRHQIELNKLNDAVAKLEAQSIAQVPTSLAYDVLAVTTINLARVVTL